MCGGGLQGTYKCGQKSPRTGTGSPHTVSLAGCPRFRSWRATARASHGRPGQTPPHASPPPADMEGTRALGLCESEEGEFEREPEVFSS